MAFARSELVGRDAYLIVELEWAGGLLLSTEDLTILTEAGEEKVVHGCLNSLTFSDQLDAPGQVGEFDGVTVAGVFPVDVPQIIARGHRLELSLAKVSRWVTGITWERRHLLFRGLVGDPEWGEAHDETRFTVEPEDVTEIAPCIPLDAVVSSRTWDTDRLGEGDIGRPYPIVFGRPGLAPYASTGRLTATRGVWVSKWRSWHKLLIAGHAVTAETVWISSDDHTTGEEVTVTHEADLLGRLVAVIDFQAADYEQADGSTALDTVTDTMPAQDDALQVFVSWPEGGGLAGEGGEAIRGAGDVLTWALSRCDAPVDIGRCKAVAPLLNHILIDGSIESSDASMWDWVQRQLLPLLPVSIQAGPDGRYPVLWRYEATDRDAVAVLDLDLEEDADFGSIRVDSSNVRNEFIVNYGLSARLGAYQRTLRVGRWEEERASCWIDGYASERIRVVASSLGAGGAGIVITIEETGALSVTEDVVAKTILITINGGTTRARNVAIQLQSCTLIQSATVEGHAGQVWDATQDQERTTALRLTTGAFGSLICDVSQRRYARPTDPGGRRVLTDELSTDYLYDDASAAAVARWRTWAYALGVRRIDVALPEGRWGWLHRGHVLRVLRGSLYLDALALVEDVELHDDGIVAYTLRLLEDPSRDPVST